MPLAELRRKRESNSEAYASKSDALLPCYPQVLELKLLLAAPKLSHWVPVLPIELL